MFTSSFTRSFTSALSVKLPEVLPQAYLSEPQRHLYVTMSATKSQVVPVCVELCCFVLNCVVGLCGAMVSLVSLCDPAEFPRDT